MFISEGALSTQLRTVNLAITATIRMPPLLTVDSRHHAMESEPGVDSVGTCLVFKECFFARFQTVRSEERRVGKECVTGYWAMDLKHRKCPNRTSARLQGSSFWPLANSEALDAVCWPGICWP